MSGYLEQMASAVQKAQAEIQELNTRLQAVEGRLAGGTPPAAAPATGLGALGSFGAAPAAAPAQLAPAAPANVTDQMILDLITPHIGNEQTKAALGNVMRGLGINALPEARPDQYPALYAGFQQVIQQAAATQAPAAAPTSII